MYVLNQNFFLRKALDFFFCPITSYFYLKGNFGVLRIKLPSCFYFQKKETILRLFFENKFFFASFLGHFLYSYNSLFSFYFTKLKLKGLGFRLKKINSNLYRFFFNFTNFFYFHVPYDFVVSIKKKRFIMISNDLASLRSVLSHLLLLKRLSVYRIRGLVYPKQIVYLKVGKKNF